MIMGITLCLDHWVCHRRFQRLACIHTPHGAFCRHARSHDDGTRACVPDHKQPAGQAVYRYDGDKDLKRNRQRQCAFALGFPQPILISIIVVVLFILVTRYTTFGRLVICNRQRKNMKLHQFILRVSPLKNINFSHMHSAIVLSALAGIISTSRATIGVPIAGQGYELDAIAACVIGGASLTGGKGTVFNTLIGVIVLGLILLKHYEPFKCCGLSAANNKRRYNYTRCVASGYLQQEGQCVALRLYILSRHTK